MCSLNARLVIECTSLDLPDLLKKGNFQTNFQAENLIFAVFWRFLQVLVARRVPEEGRAGDFGTGRALVNGGEAICCPSCFSFNTFHCQGLS